jgi:putative transposase
MARRPRLAGKQLYHHIYAWGNDRHPVFKAESHYEKYLVYLEQYSMRHNIDIIAYALMTWHIHLFVFDKQGRVSQFMNSVHGNYAQFFNRVTNGVGHVFGERFNSKIVQANNYGLWLSRYIHRQPLEAGLVKDPKDYHWSSYCAYIGLVPKGFLKPETVLEQFGPGRLVYRNYEEFVLGTEGDPVDWRRPSASIVGDEDFIKDVALLKDNDKEDTLVEDDLINLLSKRLKVNPSLLLNPRGLKERRIRHKAFEILTTEYCLSMMKISRLFNVSATAIAKVLRK